MTSRSCIFQGTEDVRGAGHRLLAGVRIHQVFKSVHLRHSFPTFVLQPNNEPRQYSIRQDLFLFLWPLHLARTPSVEKEIDTHCTSILPTSAPPCPNRSNTSNQEIVYPCKHTLYNLTHLCLLVNICIKVRRELLPPLRIRTHPHGNTRTRTLE
jgi:hypothetical protein